MVYCQKRYCALGTVFWPEYGKKEMLINGDYQNGKVFSYCGITGKGEDN